MQEKISNILQKYRSEMSKIFGESLVEVIVYGSYARGDFTVDSDIDIMILTQLDGKELERYEDMVSDKTYDFNWENNVQIMPITKNIEHFQYWKNAYMFYKNVAEEGVAVS